jgi:hypothetical protein
VDSSQTTRIAGNLEEK